jgi:hypothetical protein
MKEACKKGEDCNYWKKGRCHFYHEKSYKGEPNFEERKDEKKMYYQKPRNGGSYKSFKK